MARREYDRHMDLAMMLLAGRALVQAGKGLPWTVDEDREFIVRERWLWAQLDAREQEESQKKLEEFWGHRGMKRTLTLNPDWGKWATGTLDIPDAAFGPSPQGFRPVGRGIAVLAKETPTLAGALRWLWERGFQPVDASSACDSVVLLIPAHRVQQESDRLMAALADAGIEVAAARQSWQPEHVRIAGKYDPATGQASLSVEGARHLNRLGSSRRTGG